MQGLIITLAAVAGVANAWSYPDCEPDNCYRNLIDSRFSAEIGPFCASYIAPMATATAIPADYNNCASPSALSSACSCIAYTYTHTSSASSSVPTTSSSATTTSSSSVMTTSSGTGVVTSTPSSSYTKPTSSMTSSSVEYTTSTVKTTKTQTITSCAPTVTNCPVGHTTVVTIDLYTTVCPVSTPVSTPVVYTSTYKTTETITISSCKPEVTNCPYTTKPMTTTTIYPVTTICTTSAPAIGTISSVVVVGPTTSVPVGTAPGSGPSKTTSSAALQVTAAAGRVNAGVEMLVGAAAVVAAFL